MTYYAVLDTNVLVSALLKNGSVPWQVAEDIAAGDGCIGYFGGGPAEVYVEALILAGFMQKNTDIR